MAVKTAKESWDNINIEQYLQVRSQSSCVALWIVSPVCDIMLISGDFIEKWEKVLRKATIGSPWSYSFEKWSRKVTVLKAYGSCFSYNFNVEKGNKCAMFIAKDEIWTRG